MARERTAENKGFLKGAIWIAAGGFLAKIIGALYRIPLTNFIGGYGLGLYQLVYPSYCLLLTVSATGIPSSIAKLTAERIGKGQSTMPLFKSAIKLFLCIGITGAAILAIVAPYLSKAQNAEAVVGGYYALAPSVALVSAISVFRGWFQGKNDMSPTAFSEITEQLIKVGFGLLFAFLYRDNIQKAVVFLLLSVSLSELCTLFLMILLFRRAKLAEKPQNEGGRYAMKRILRMSIPVTFGSALIPLSGLLDSVLVPRLLGEYAGDAVTLYGLFAGGAVTVINLPVSICYGLAAASIPRVAMIAANREENTGKRIRKKVFSALVLTAVLSGLAAVGLYLFSEYLVKIVFRSLTDKEQATLSALIKSLSVSAFTLSCTQTLSACLTAQGKPQYGALSMLIGITAKTVIYTRLLKNPEISIFGLATATNICYLVAFCLDLLYNLFITRRGAFVKRTGKNE